GGLLATGSSALLRYAYGAPRDQVIGIAAAMPDGAVVRAGGRVVKNVAGYDLCKLFTGSMGALGVLVEATFRVRPLPPSLRTWVGVFPSASAVEGALATLMDSSLQPTFVQVADPGAWEGLAPFLPAQDTSIAECWALCLGADGHEQLSLWTAEEARRLTGPAWSAVLEGAESAELREALVGQCRPIPDTSGLCIRVSVLPSDTLNIMNQWRERLRGSSEFRLSTVAAAGNGVIYANLVGLPGLDEARLGAVAGEMLTWLEESAAGLGGSFVILRCPSLLREGGAKMWGRSAPTAGLMRRIRQQLDPHLVLNRGRLFNDEEGASAV
ncbi:MAG: FAD-binding oxidoreductase, partial [Armatimonadota bacterium]|nr:FAD-binding oxidoreductase [Armatimonadota bacterium]